MADKTPQVHNEAPSQNPTQSLDSLFYRPADSFFRDHTHTALTFDDITLATLYSEVLPRDAQLDTLLAHNLPLRMPIVSADMDTVTEAEM
ncbi:MAG: IMP dehydrogenase, partial [Verrucomicrobiota bacterium]